MTASVTRFGILDMQVCVPKTWADDEVKAFAEQEFPSGTTGGWQIRKEGHKLLNGAPERVDCAEFDENCHIVLEV